MTHDASLKLGEKTAPLRLDDHLEMLPDIRALLERQDFTVMNLHPEPDDPSAMNMAYSIGLARFGLPEMIGLGKLDVIDIAEAIDTIGQRWVSLKQARMGRYTDIFAKADTHDMPVAVQYIDGESLNRNSIALMVAYYGTVPAMAQLLWPEPNGHLPTEEGYRGSEFHQPVLKAFVPGQRPVH